jgi:trigger factor
MKILDLKTEERQEILTVELEPAEIEEAAQKAYEKLVKDAEIPGFRKGKAPRVVLEQHVGKDKLFQETLNFALPRAIADAINEKGLKPIADPGIKFVKKEPVTVEMKVPLEPVVKLGDYKQIRIKSEPVNIKKEDVDNALEDLRHNRATYEPVERPVELNDLVVMDIEASAEGKTFLDYKGTNYNILSEFTYPAPGFPEQLLDMKRDEEKEFKLTLSKNYSQRELAEKEALFKVKINEVKEERLPELTDEFAKSLGSNIENMTALRERIETNMRSSAEEKARVAFEDQLMDILVENTEMEFPPVLVEMELNNLIGQYMQQLQMSARDQEHYRQMAEKVPHEELRKRYRPIASKRVAASLALEEVAEAEKIEVSDADIDAEIERMVQHAGDKQEEQRQFFNNPQSRGYIKNMLKTQQTIQRLTEIAKSSAETESEAKPKKKEAK